MIGNHEVPNVPVQHNTMGNGTLYSANLLHAVPIREVWMGMVTTPSGGWCGHQRDVRDLVRYLS